MSCLLADVGGTRTRFALLTDGQVGPIESVRTGAYASIHDAVHHFLNGQAASMVVDRAVIAAAGPVSGGRCKLTNARWILDAESLRQALHLRSVRLVNDLEALAWAVPHFGADDLVAVGDGSAVQGEPVAVIAPGTGLGLSCYLPGAPPRVVASEAGHATMAATDAGDAAILAWLRQRFGHVSAERVLSGAGLVNLQAALAIEEGRESGTVTPEEIVRGAVYGSPRDSAALELFCDFLGSFAGDIALTFGTRGGVLFAGGIAPHILPVLLDSSFRARFTAKGRFADYVGQIPTAVIVRPEPAFLGLAALASRGDG
ncbi:glucokinase [Reyranella sp.]|jgi:glucokinase|uniref:glucokinase n=1 Tax=Reyranella sp. TaxID=1929291 RepID=UPI000BD7E642|nr:glucokinase [Reyranella sp.]OYY47078.1 MAG: glucokinase [Rhodospirillales bacterium 35-66-84]OYZ97098.1 MAG: glucokinase [Rhodospirillales bacterium 24-66-33]OZB27574.1 MAG: glucokinase [Rhodospirillales bacterium 39-66-50]HQS14012.1 glucokinase [Reyranella sp.]HQT10497.1 glucokinase [Reyranella sp.]